MNTAQVLLVLEDMFFSFLAAFGFGSLSNPPFKALVCAGLLGAFGHGLRYFLITVYAVHIVPASFLSAVCVGFLAFFIAKKMHTLVEVFTFPAVLPMIPGIPAYNTMISLVKFLNASQDTHRYLEQVFYNGFLALFILSALVLGILCPYLLMSKKCWVITRHAFGISKAKNS
jgi:uncharacterized membrane protein YjjB (DUF3815 family)